MSEDPQPVVARRRARPRRRKVFGDDEEVRLSELDLDPSHHYAFSAGHSLAMIHRYGVVHGDLHGSHSLFDAYSGVTGFIDLNPFDHRTDVDPERMVQDILIAGLALPRPWLVGMIAGYVRTSHLAIDPLHPGYTSALLDLLGGEVVTWCRPAPPVLTGEQCDRLLGPLLDDTDGGLRLRTDVVVDPESAAREDASMALCGLLLAGLDCTPLLDAPGVPSVVADILGPLAELGGIRPLVHGLVSPSGEVLRALGERAAWDADTARLHRAMTDVCDWLAARVDRPASDTAVTNSIRIAQASLMALQRGNWPVRERELVELTVLSRHRALSWYRDALVADPVHPLHGHLFSYVNSRLLTYQSLFRAGADHDPATAGRNRLWSANWRGLALARTAQLQQLTWLRSGDFRDGPFADDEIPMAVRFVAARVMQALEDNFRAAMEDVPLFLMTCRDAYERIADERARTAEIWQLMGADDLDVAAFAAGDLVAEQLTLLTDSQRYDFDDFVARADDE